MSRHRFVVLRNTSGRVKVAWHSGAVPSEWEAIGVATSTTALGAYLAVMRRLPDDLNAKIRPLVILLNLMGFLTVSSCGGHVEQGVEHPGSVSVIVQGLAQLHELQALAEDVFGSQASAPQMWCDLVLQHRTDAIPLDWFRIVLVFEHRGPQVVPTVSDYQWAVTEIGGWAERRGMPITPLAGETEEYSEGAVKRVVTTWDTRPKTSPTRADGSLHYRPFVPVDSRQAPTEGRVAQLLQETQNRRKEPK